MMARSSPYPLTLSLSPSFSKETINPRAAEITPMETRLKITDEEGSHKVELLLGDAAVSSMHINDLEVKIGNTYLKMGGIGGVGTLEEHRMKGYSRRVMDYSIEYMRNNGYDISMLFGIPEYYSKWGYVSTLAEYKIRVPIRNAERAKPGLHARPMGEDDIEPILAIYERSNLFQTGPVRRETGKWLKFRKGSDWRIPADGTVFEDNTGRVVSYYASDRWPRVVRITEVGSVEPRFYENMLRHMSDIAIQKRATELEIFVPFDHEFANLCKRMGCTISTEYHYDAMGMGRIIDLTKAMSKLMPLLSQRLIKADRTSMPSRLSIRTDMGNFTIDTRGLLSFGEEPSVDWVELPQYVLMQLMLGYRTVDDVLADPRTRTEGNTAQVLKAIFPSGHPYIWLADWF